MPVARPLPIAIAIPAFHPGGTERQMIELARRLDPKRWEVHVACFRREGAWLSRLDGAVASVGEFPLSSFAHPSTAGQMRRFARWCRDRSVALVHTTDLYTNIFFLPGAWLAGVPVRIGSRREIAAGKSRAQIALQRASYACAHRVVANASAVKDRLRREGVAARRISVVPNGIDAGAFAPRRVGERLRRICLVANLRPGKGHATLIDAAPAILQHLPDARFVFVGDGTERAALEQLVRARGLAGAFDFAGHVERVHDRLVEADLFVLPSESEAFPNAVLEAMAAGLPVVATDVGGVAEVIESGTTGLLVPPRDPAALAHAICGLCADPDEARRLADNGRTLVQSRYAFGRMVALFEELYNHELTRRAPDRAVQSQLASL